MFEYRGATQTAELQCAQSPGCSHGRAWRSLSGFVVVKEVGFSFTEGLLQQPIKVQNLRSMQRAVRPEL